MQNKKNLILVLGILTCHFGLAQTSFTLQKALKSASENNPILKTQKYDIDLAQADVITAKLIPNIILNNQSLFLIDRSLYPANTNILSNKNNQIWFQATKKFQIAGQRTNKIDVAQKNVIYNQQNIEEIKRNLFQVVASKWLDVWTAKKQLEIISKAKNNIDSVLVINKNRLKNEVITLIDYNRTELLANQYGLQIKTAEQNYKNEIANFKFLLGTTEPLTIDDKDSFEYLSNDNSDQMLKNSLETRSDILASKSAIELSKSNIKLQKSLAIPQPELGLIYNPQNSVPYVGIFATIELPFFDRNQGEIQKSKVSKLKADQDLYSKQQEIQTQLATLYEAYLLQKKNVADFKNLLKQSDLILAGVKYAYLRGGTSIIDFLEAQRSWLDTQQQYYDALQQYRSIYINLLYQSGLINTLAK